MYTVRIFKSWGARDASRRWVNNYEIEAGTAALTSLGAVANDIAAAEKLIHQTTVQFLSYSVSTWEPDSHPYNPLSFVTGELSGTGALAAASQLLDSNVCFLVKYQAATGRSGRRFYRGCLAEQDVEPAGDGSFTVSPGSNFQDAGGAMTSFKNALAPYLAGGTNATKIILAGNSASSIQRIVTAVKSGGVVVNRRNHRYFDRRAI